MPRRSSHTMKTVHSIADNYYFVWAFAMPITSYSLLPSIQGTTVGYLMCFLSLPVVLLYGGTDRRRYINFMLAALLIWVFMLFTTQLSDAATSFEPDLTKVTLVDYLDTHTFVMRDSLFTQSLYLAAVVLYVGYVYVFYKPKWDRWLLAAATLFALYGIYEVVYFLATGQAGDFISNRRFGQNLAGADISDTFSGSAFQTIDIKGITVQRLKSLTGEPSMYALSMFPFWVYFNARAKSRLPVWIIGASLIMSTSSTALIGYLCYLAIRVRKLGFDPIKATVTLLVLLVIAFLARDYIADMYRFMVSDKVDSTSAMERSDNFTMAINMWMDGTVPNQLFGVGFGYIRSTDLFSTLLVNIGVVGTAFVAFVVLYPAFKLDWEPEGIALRQCCVATGVMMMVSVPEFAYLAPWTLIAMAYARLYRQSLAARLGSVANMTNANAQASLRRSSARSRRRSS
jgi:hypothetical protein